MASTNQKTIIKTIDINRDIVKNNNSPNTYITVIHEHRYILQLQTFTIQK